MLFFDRHNVLFHALDVPLNFASLLSGSTFRILSRNIVLRDAVSNFVMGLAGTLERLGGTVYLYAQDVAPEYAGVVRHSSQLAEELRPADLLVCNYSIFDEYFPSVCSLECARRILYFHNVTPGSYFRPYANDFANLLDASVDQFSHFRSFEIVMANSAYSLESIRPYLGLNVQTCVFPPCCNLSRFDSSHEPVLLPQVQHILLWVGRVVPHKRPQFALELLHQLFCLGEDIALVLVGGGKNDFPNFADTLDATLASLPDALRHKVLFLESITDGQLAYLYAKASLLLCTSAHEGYCVPLVEAMYTGLPVAALPQPAVEETLNGYGCLLSEIPEEAARQLRAMLHTGKSTVQGPVNLPNDQQMLAKLLKLLVV